MESSPISDGSRHVITTSEISGYTAEAPQSLSSTSCLFNNWKRPLSQTSVIQRQVWKDCSRWVCWNYCSAQVINIILLGRRVSDPRAFLSCRRWYSTTRHCSILWWSVVSSLLVIWRSEGDLSCESPWGARRWSLPAHLWSFPTIVDSLFNCAYTIYYWMQEATMPINQAIANCSYEAPTRLLWGDAIVLKHRQSNSLKLEDVTGEDINLIRAVVGW